MGKINSIIPLRVKRKLKNCTVPLFVHYYEGPKLVNLTKDQAAVTCLVKNGQFYIASFIEHYFMKGFKHIIFLDNGSTDKTISIIKKYPNVSIYKTSLPVSKYQGILKKQLALKVRGGWCLDADIDEFFDYPFSDIISLQQFLQYLNMNGYNAVLTQMLDMFSENSLSHLIDTQNEDVKSTYRFYDVSGIKQIPYQQSGLVKKYANYNKAPGNMNLYMGGIRKQLYGNDCLLSKHSLFSRQSKLDMFPHVHFINKSQLADVSCVLYHYKFTSNAYETAVQNRDSFSATSQGYSDFIDLIRCKPDFRIRQEHARELQSVNELIDNGFLVISEKYSTFVHDLPACHRDD